MSDRRKNRAKAPAYPMVAGIDIGSVNHWVAAPSDGDPNVRKFGTTTSDLNQIVDWLHELGVTSVAMESTSVYWIPLYELLESRGIEPVLVNARQLHNVPGRKTDYKDCQWLQLLHSRGLLRGSFRPSAEVARLRAFQRQLANLVEERTRYVQWMQKSLDQMNVQVHRAVADLTGKTGMAIVRAIVAGERDPQALAKHRDGRCRKTVDEIARCLEGTWRDEHLFNLEGSLSLYDTIEKQIALYEARILKEFESLQATDRSDQLPPPHPNKSKARMIKTHGGEQLRTTLWRILGVDLTRIDGIAPDSAKTILAEVGTNLATFPTEDHFVSWLRLCPRTPISGGRVLKKKRNALGASRVTSVLHMSAVSLNRSKTALGAGYRRIARIKGASTAIFATARKLAQLIYRALRFGQDYVDMGMDAYEAKYEARRMAGLVESARSLGYTLIKEEPALAS